MVMYNLVPKLDLALNPLEVIKSSQRILWKTIFQIRTMHVTNVRLLYVSMHAYHQSVST